MHQIRSWWCRRMHGGGPLPSSCSASDVLIEQHAAPRARVAAHAQRLSVSACPLGALSLDVAASHALVASVVKSGSGWPHHSASCADPETGLHVKLRTGHSQQHQPPCGRTCCKVTQEGRAARAFAYMAFLCRCMALLARAGAAITPWVGPVMPHRPFHMEPAAGTVPRRGEAGGGAGAVQRPLWSGQSLQPLKSQLPALPSSSMPAQHSGFL